MSGGGSLSNIVSVIDPIHDKIDPLDAKIQELVIGDQATQNAVIPVAGTMAMDYFLPGSGAALRAAGSAADGNWLGAAINGVGAVGGLSGAFSGAPTDKLAPLESSEALASTGGEGLLDAPVTQSAFEGFTPAQEAAAQQASMDAYTSAAADYGTPLSMDGVQMTQAIKDATPWYESALYKAQGFANQLGSKEGKLAMNGAQKLMQGNQQQKQQQPQVLPQAPMDAGGFTGRPAQSFQQFSPYVGGFSGFQKPTPYKKSLLG